MSFPKFMKCLFLVSIAIIAAIVLCGACRLYQIHYSSSDAQVARIFREMESISGQKYDTGPYLERIDQLWHEFGTLGSRAVPTLEKRLQSTDVYERCYDAVALGFTGSEEATHILADLVRKDRCTAVRFAAIRGLSIMGDESALPVLFEALLDSPRQGPEVRLKACLAIGRLVSESEVPQLLYALDDPYVPVVDHTLSILGQLRDQRAVPAVVEALKHPDPQVREEAARSLGEIGGDAAFAALAKALHDHESKVRKVAEEALSKLGDNPG